MSKSTPAADARYRLKNSSRPCSAEGCDKPRRRASRFCLICEKHARHFGHPKAGRIPEAILSEHRFKFSEFITAHIETPQVQAAIQLCDDLIQHGLPHDLPKWRVKQLARTRGDVDIRLRDLRDLQVTGREVLVAAGGVFLLSRRSPRTLPDDVRLTFRIGLEVLKVRPFPFKITKVGNSRVNVPGALPRRSIGLYLRRHLAVFCLRVDQGLHAEVQAGVDQEALLATEFIPTIPATTEGHPTS